MKTMNITTICVFALIFGCVSFVSAGDLVDDFEQNFVVRIILDQRTEGIGMRVERSEITRFVLVDQLSPMASTTGP